MAISAVLETLPTKADRIEKRWQDGPRVLLWKEGDRKGHIWIIVNDKVIADILPKTSVATIEAIVMGPEDVGFLLDRIKTMKEALRRVLECSLTSNELAPVRDMVKMALKEEH